MNMLIKTIVQYNQLSDLSTAEQELVESISDECINDLDINVVNDFLNGLYLFHNISEEDFWKSLS